MAFNTMLAGLAAGKDSVKQPLAPHEGHFKARAKRIIFLFMHGGPSHVDLFDPKPALAKYDGKEPPFQRTRVKFGKRGNLLKSPWSFRPTGKSGIPMSSLWQHLPKVADDLCMLHGLCDTNVAHGGACMKLFTGSESLIRPSMGSWVSYGLGTENQNLPSFITICPTSLHGGVENFGSAFLPNIHQGVPLGTPGYPNTPAKDARFEFLKNEKLSRKQQRLLLDQLKRINQQHQKQAGRNPQLEARIQSFEMAFRMQTSVPEITDVSDEPEHIHDLYGPESKNPGTFAANCLLARRLAEKGVKFIQLYHRGWDHHDDLPRNIRRQCADTDRASAALVTDLKQRGLLNDTLVIWGGEFGRTNYSQGELTNTNYGRDHHPKCFSIWMAGAGVKPGMTYGQTDEFGYNVIQDPVHIHDFQATLMHLLGIDHERLTFKFQGRRFRLTDVHGQVVRDILA